MILYGVEDTEIHYVQITIDMFTVYEYVHIHTYHTHTEYIYIYILQGSRMKYEVYAKLW